jgi:hypothetical protein
MRNHKIIFAGPVGAGKTTAIASVSDIEPVVTDEMASDMTRSRKAETTVAMDYGLIKLNGGEHIHLYGTPGQERFDFMWDVLTHGGSGLILLINNTRPDPFRDLEFFLGAFGDFIRETQVAVGVTRMDLNGRRPAIDEYHEYLERRGLKMPVFGVDARKKADVSRLVESLLSALDPGLVA